MFKYTLVSYLMTLCAVLVGGQVSGNGAGIRMTDSRVISPALQRSHPCTFSAAGVTTCPVKSKESAQFKATIIVNGGKNKLAITRLLITMQLGDEPDITTKTLTCQVAGGSLVINTAATSCSVSKLAEGKYTVAPYEFGVPAVTKTKVLDLKIWADVVKWSDDTTSTNWFLGKVTVQVNP